MNYTYCNRFFYINLKGGYLNLIEPEIIVFSFQNREKPLTNKLTT